MSPDTMTLRPFPAVLSSCALIFVAAQSQDRPARITVLHAARLLDVESGRMLTPGEVLVRGERIVEASAAVTHPPGAETIDLGDRTLLPGLIDAHVHLFLHPGAMAVGAGLSNR
jgi:adenine deaminase